MDVAQILLREPALLAIWLILLLLTGPALIVLASPDGVRRPWQALRQTAVALRGHRQQRGLRRQEAADLTRYAGELAVAAEHAAAAARRWREHWEQAQQRVDETWRTWQDAEARLARLRAAAAFTVPRVAATPARFAERERFLHRAVLAAARHGELPIAVAADALAGRHGWDPRLHPAEQELHVCRAVAAHLGRCHHRAAAAERVAWHDAQLAAATRDSLRVEAAAAAARAADPRRRPSGAAVRRPAGAVRSRVARAA
jgi:hypothetical protein